MRRSYISPEYQNRAVYGTLNMVEESTFFGAKMLEVEDSISIDNQDIIYYQRSNGEQLDISTETSLDSYIYSPGSSTGDKFKQKYGRIPTNDEISDFIELNDLNDNSIV